MQSRIWMLESLNEAPGNMCKEGQVKTQGMGTINFDGLNKVW